MKPAIKILEQCGLVTREKVGTSHVIKAVEANLKKLEEVWWMIDESFTLEVPVNTNIMDALKLVPGIDIKKTKNGSFISSVDGKEGYYIYEIDGKIPHKAAKYAINKDIIIELKRLMPVIGKKVRVTIG